jgi:predicted HD phosphohydrolase
VTTARPTVGFTAMADGTAADYALLETYERDELARFPERVLGWLRAMDDHTGYQVTRLQHSLQAATRAHRAGEDEETVVCALVHDIGDMLAPANHSEVAAAVLRPYVSERNHWILKHHGVFQGVYWFHHVGADPHARDRHADHPWYQACVNFCADYDQNSFDPTTPTEPLEFFEPLVHRVFHPDRVRLPTSPDSRQGA